jgi:Asp-tRNA(Asn)/Glu-tRNA(Gln) amidotransferase A subunit family amidase
MAFATHSASYDPRTAKLLSFHDAVPRFVKGMDSPRAYLERCIEVLEAREAEVKAFVSLNLAGARKAADESTARYKAGRQLGPVDGLPIGVKDLYETQDMSTGMGSSLFAGWESGRDAASVFALRRQAGAVIVGKTVTTEFGFSHPGPTVNPFDPRRTPGGSSSGSAAAVSAGMLPAALGSQVMGSLIRPSSYCGIFGFKPTYGAINRGGGHSNLSQANLGVHAGSLADAWAVAFETSRLAGGDPGYAGIPAAGADLPPARKPRVLVLLETAGWPIAESAAKDALDELIQRLAAASVTILSKHDHWAVAGLEKVIKSAVENSFVIVGWELKWPLLAYREKDGNRLSSTILSQLASWEQITIADYRRALARRSEMRNRLLGLTSVADAFVGLAAPGAAPVGLDATGDPVFNVPASTLGAPVFTLPLMAVRGMPLGLQVMGFPGRDEALSAVARWIVEAEQREESRDA